MKGCPTRHGGRTIFYLTISFQWVIFWVVENHVHDYINLEDSMLGDIIIDGTYIPTKEVKDRELTNAVITTRKE